MERNSCNSCQSWSLDCLPGVFGNRAQTIRLMARAEKTTTSIRDHGSIFGICVLPLQRLCPSASRPRVSPYRFEKLAGMSRPIFFCHAHPSRSTGITWRATNHSTPHDWGGTQTAPTVGQPPWGKCWNRLSITLGGFAMPLLTHLQTMIP